MQKSYQSSFDSRQYMLSEDFEIFYYSDINFRSVPAHTHSYFEFYIFMEGDVAMEIEDRTYDLSFGDIVVVPVGISHRAIVRSPEKPYRRFVFWISQKYFERLTAESPDYGWLIQRAAKSGKYISRLAESDCHTLQAKLIRLLEEVHTDRFGKNTMLILAVNELILSLTRRVYETEETRRSGEEDLLSSLISYIGTHLEEDLSLDSIASRYYLSKYYLSHMFKKQFGISLHQYIVKKRIQSIAELLAAGENASTASVRFGFQDYSVFYRAFIKEYGISPNEYRNIHYLKASRKNA